MRMKDSAKELDALLDLSKCRVISITGGGGKTSLMLALGRHFAKSGLTLITTTTRIFPPEEDGSFVSMTVSPSALIKRMAEYGASPRLIVAAREKAGEKLSGYSPQEITSFIGEQGPAKIIIEADGSRGLSLKAYEEWEPPITTSTDCQIIVLGADVFIEPLSFANTFRLDKLQERFPLPSGRALSLESCAAILSDRHGYLKNSPEKARRVLLINKCDLISEQKLDEILKTLPLLLMGYDHVVLVFLKSEKFYGKADIFR